MRRHYSITLNPCQQHFSGATLKQYEKIQPGSADRIFRYAETEQANRHSVQQQGATAEIGKVENERQAILSSLWMHITTNVCAVIIFTGLLVAGCYALSLGHTATAIAIFAVPIWRMVIAMTKTHPSDSEREPRREN